MILAYTGDGKGKTSACLGQVVRAMGRGWSVAFAQFMKRDGEAGEQVFLKKWLGDDFMAGGAGFFRHEEERAVHREAAERTLSWSLSRLPDVELLILDESLYALGNRLVSLDELQALLEIAKQHNTHIILSGRGFPDALLDKVDLVTEMREIKHPWRTGQSALKGIDF